MQKWYQEPWMWLVVGIPVATVIAGLSTVWIAVHQADSPVVSDYYRQGLAVNERIKSRRQAQKLGITAVIVFSDDSTQMRLHAPVRPNTVAMLLAHPTDKSRDHKMTLHYDAQSRLFVGPAIKATGRYYAQITAPGNDWLLSQEVFLSPGQPVEISAR
ncbi:MAG: hypothetical protein D6694_05430 [Gammaproteobacteria bacterium]|nr:MAG: hypothetical protein D6694_05430 [Gammaproteobacteria bacterium]